MFVMSEGEVSHQVLVQDYFKSLSSPAKKIVEDVDVIAENYDTIWKSLKTAERDQIIDENIIQPQAVIKYQNGNGNASSGVSGVGVGVGVDSVYPRLKMKTGQKVVEVDEGSRTGSHAEDLESCNMSTFSYFDEHSAPFSWRTKSQQDLSFESGRPVSLVSEEINVNGLETLTSAPSKILTRPASSNFRYSKGNPLFAKAVKIPEVPSIPKPDSPTHTFKSYPEPEVPPKPEVPPHNKDKDEPNNFVLESSPNRIILDFGSNIDTNTATSISPSPRASSPEGSTKSTQGLLAKMKEKKNTLKRSLSASRKKKDSSSSRPNSRNGFNNGSSKHDTLDSRMSGSRYSTLDSRNGSRSNTLDSRSSRADFKISTDSVLPRSNSKSGIEQCNNGRTSRNSELSVRDISSPIYSSSQSSTLSSLPPPSQKIVKPSKAPPPPPSVIQQKVAAAPSRPPSVQQLPSKAASLPTEPPIQQLEQQPSTKSEQHAAATAKAASLPPRPPPRRSSIKKEDNKENNKLLSPSGSEAEEPLSQFKIDLNTDTDIPKTGFDFLDNW